MLGRTCVVAVLGALVLLSIPMCPQAEDGTDRSGKKSSDRPSLAPVKISEHVLASHGFTFDDHLRAMCTINGPEGPCRVEAFVFGEKKEDDAGYTCRKLDKATYAAGHCIKGKLDGWSLVIADGSKKLSKEAYISYFDKGQIAYPALTSFLTGDLNLDVTEKGSSYGCVYFGKWNESSTRWSCPFFMNVYGDDIFSETNAQQLRDGTFNLDHYRARFFEFLDRNIKLVYKKR